MLQLVRTLILLLIVFLCGVGIYTLMGGGRQAGPPGAVVTQSVALTPVSRGEILSQMKLVTVEREYNIPVLGSAYKKLPEAQGAVGAMMRAALGGTERVPGTTEEIVYEMVTTVTAGIDLARLQDTDIQNDATQTTITLPQPEVFSVVTDFERSGVRYRSGPSVPFLSHSSQLIADLQKTGERKHRLEAQNDAEFLHRARTQAETALLKLLKATHPGRDVAVRFGDGGNRSNGRNEITATSGTVADDR